MPKKAVTLPSGESVTPRAHSYRIIAFANQKGGVGKTTSAVNIAASLGSIGKKILMLDMDPQGNTTSGVGISKKNIKYSSHDVLLSRCTAKQAILKTKYKNLSIIPANISLAGAEFELFELNFEESEIRSEFRLRQALATSFPRGLEIDAENANESNVETGSSLEFDKDFDYDYIIIDCPPSLGMLTVNALSASDCVVIPLQCEFYALEGLSQLMITIGRIKKLYNEDLFVAGILLTMFNGRLLLSSQVLREIKKHYADKLFRTPISRSVKLSEAPSFGTPVLYHDKNSKGAEEYLAVAKELSERV